MAKKKKKPRRSSSRSRATRRSRTNRKEPLLAAAVLCDKVLREEDNVVSLVRLIDVFNISGTASTLPPGMARLVLFVMFRSGEALGVRRLRIVAKSPTGDILSQDERKMEFKGDEHGAVAAIDLKMGITQTGLYWFDVTLNDNLMTRIPLRVRYEQVPAKPSARSRRRKSQKSP